MFDEFGNPIEEPLDPNLEEGVFAPVVDAATATAELGARAVDRVTGQVTQNQPLTDVELPGPSTLGTEPEGFVGEQLDAARQVIANTMESLGGRGPSGVIGLGMPDASPESSSRVVTDPVTGEPVPPGERIARAAELRDRGEFERRAAEQPVPGPSADTPVNRPAPAFAGLDVQQVMTPRGPSLMGQATVPPGPEGARMFADIVRRSGGIGLRYPQAMADALSNPETFPGGSFLLDRNAVAAAGQAFNPTDIQQFDAQGQRFVTGGQGSGMPAFRFGEEMSATIRPQVPDWLRQMQVGTVEKLTALRQEALQGSLDVNRLAAEGGSQLAELRQAQISELSRFDEDRAAELRGRWAQLDSAIDRIENNQIDPDGFFGEGAGRRIAFGAALALGALGSAISGGPNQAMEILEGRIDRHIRAQEANQANARAAVGARGNALGMLRSITGDERAAMESLRAAEYGAAITHLQSVIQNASDPVIRANGNALIMGARARQLQAMAESIQNSWEVEMSGTLQGRTRDPNRSINRVQQAMAAGMGGAPQTQQTQPTPTRQRPAASGQRRPARRQRRPRVNPQQPAMVDTLGPGAESAEATNVRAASELDRNAMQRQPEPIPTNTRAVAAGNASEALRQWNALPEARRNQIREGAAMHAELAQAVNNIVRFQREHGGSITRDQFTEAASMSAESFQAKFRNLMEFGALTGNERQIAERVGGDPSEWSIWRARGGLSAGAFLGRLNALTSIINAGLGTSGFSLGTLRSELE